MKTKTRQLRKKGLALQGALSTDNCPAFHTNVTGTTIRDLLPNISTSRAGHTGYSVNTLDTAPFTGM